MKTLFVLRHAKAVPDTGALDDVDRPLAERGRNDMTLMGEHLAGAGVRPEIIYCSPAVRTRQTLDCLLDALGSPPVMFDDLLYGASVDELIGVARRTPAAFASAMFVGHNPGMGDLVGALTRSYAEFPTGAFATLAVAHTDWAELATAELRSVVVPRQLRAPD